MSSENPNEVFSDADKFYEKWKLSGFFVVTETLWLIAM